MHIDMHTGDNRQNQTSSTSNNLIPADSHRELEKRGTHNPAAALICILNVAFIP